jgi:hypothetical protein
MSEVFGPPYFGFLPVGGIAFSQIGLYQLGLLQGGSGIEIGEWEFDSAQGMAVGHLGAIKCAPDLARGKREAIGSRSGPVGLFEKDAWFKADSGVCRAGVLLMIADIQRFAWRVMEESGEFLFPEERAVGGVSVHGERSEGCRVDENRWMS